MANDLNLLQQFGGGVFVGAAEDTLLGPAIQSTGNVLGMTDEERAQFTEEIRRTPLGNIGRGVGKLAAFLGPGLGAAGVGRMAFNAVAREVLPRVGVKMFAENQARRMAGRAVNKSWIERAVEITGEATGIGGDAGLRAAIEGGNQDEILDSFLKTTAIGVGFGGALTGAAKAVFPSTRFRNFSDEAIAEAKAHTTKLGKDSLKTLREEQKKLSKEIVDSGGEVPMLAQEIEGGGVQGGLFPSLGAPLFRRHGDDVALEVKAGTAVGDVKLATRTRSGVVGGETGLPTRKVKELLRKQKKLQQNLTAQKAVETFIEPDDSAILRMLRVTPINPDAKPFRMALHGLALNLTKSPVTMARQLGLSNTRFMDVALNAQAEVNVGLARVNSEITKFMTGIGKEVKAKNKKELDKILFDIAETSHKGGTLAVEAKYGTKVAGLFDEAMDGMKAEQRAAIASGGEQLLTVEELAAQGRQSAFPIIFNDSVEDSVIDASLGGIVAKIRGISINEADDILNRVSQHRRPSYIPKDAPDPFSRFGDLSFQRQIPGTIKELRDAGLPIVTDVAEVLRRSASNAMIRKIMGDRFGPRGELGNIVKEAARLEGASTGLTNTLVDHVLMIKTDVKSMKAVADAITSMEVITKMTFGAIPNAFQTFNNTLFFGVGSATRGLAKFVKKENRQEVSRALGMLDSVFSAIRNAYAGSPPRTYLDRMAQRFLKASLFETTEQYNRIMTGVVGLDYVERQIARGMAGKLRGDRLIRTKKAFSELELNYDKILARSKGGGGNPIFTAVEKDTAVINSVRKTQFKSGRLDLPIWWRTPVGRVVFQFKTFAFNQSKLLRDSVIGEASNGNYTPLALVFAGYPSQGSLIRMMVDTAKDKKKRKVSALHRHLDNVASMGGFGIAYNAVLSARFGDIEGFFGGPFSSDFFQAAEIAGRAVVDPETFFPGIKQFVNRQPVAEGTAFAGRVAVGAAGVAAVGITQLFDEAVKRKGQ